MIAYAGRCDAVIGTGGSWRILEDLERTNQFVVPLGARRRWYRYHQLFAELLRHELDRAEPVHATTSPVAGPVFPVTQHEESGVIAGEDVLCVTAPPGHCLAGPWCACWRGCGQSDVTSVMAMRVLASSTVALRPA